MTKTKKGEKPVRPRQTWSLNPVTRVKPSAKIYSRAQARKERLARLYEE